jgi:hypothetical protein
MDTNPDYQPIQSTPPEWMGDYWSRETVMRVPVKLDAAQFNAVDAVKVVVTANRAVDAVEVAVTALSGPIPSGTVIDLGGKKFVRLTAAAAKDAVSLAVSALATALVTNDTGTYKGVGKKSAPSGTPIGRTLAEADAGDAWGPAADTDDELYLITRDLSDLTMDATTEIYRHHKTVKINYLPGFTTMAAGIKTKIRALYACIGGKD